MIADASDTVCIIPARGGSKRLPRKNILPLGGKPLIAWAVEAAAESGVFGEIVISTEDEQILELAATIPHATPLARNPSMAGDMVTVVDTCRAVLAELNASGKVYKKVGILLPSSPFRKAEDIRKAAEMLQNEDVSAVLSVIPMEYPPQWAVWSPEGYIRPYFEAYVGHKRQNLDSLFRHDGGIYMAKVAPFMEKMLYRGESVVPLYVDPEDSVDIDTQKDFELAQFILSKREQR